ncbi:MAG: hypothetical protein GY906_11500 [bacterium]|nr:hypothetical protein [bacterium]
MTEMGKETIDKILSLAEPKELMFEEREYTSRQIHPVKRPLADALELRTLKSLVDYVKSNVDVVLDGEKPPAFLIHICSPTKIQLLSGLSKDWRQREVLATTKAIVANEFLFERYMGQETFMTLAQACFMDAHDRKDMLQVIGTVKSSETETFEDDGITQKVTASAGVQKLKKVDLPNPVTLAPYRTFPDLDQPSSEFVLRIGKDEAPVFGLWPVRDESWQLLAMKDAYDFLTAELGDSLPVIY